ncbi:hypothetical protein DPMN_125620 [Dreissena polymorpha]|uniref:Uncharacterized protein n=1 Tax=Dreissena polymorpha TaxID=45954 RepID=A0A9D4GXV5_DREPO|nr:hypothetical protein DPMN_125620 [Dreissena polymorpha]
MKANNIPEPTILKVKAYKIQTRENWPENLLKKVIRMLKDNDICNINMADIDIAHRLPNKNDPNREIIVRIVSRQTKGLILANRKKLRGTNIFINEDMTRLNLHVLMCVKKKMADEVSDEWFNNVKITFKNHMDKPTMAQHNSKIK